MRADRPLSEPRRPPRGYDWYAKARGYRTPAGTAPAPGHRPRAKTIRAGRTTHVAPRRDRFAFRVLTFRTSPSVSFRATFVHRSPKRVRKPPDSAAPTRAGCLHERSAGQSRIQLE